MQTFKDWHSIPVEFEGHCYVENNEAQYWFIKNKVYHREDGPAVVRDDGSKHWLINDEYHRLDGPAVVFFDGRCEYWINGEEFSEQQYWNHPLVVKYKLNKLLEL